MPLPLSIKTAQLNRSNYTKVSLRIYFVLSSFAILNKISFIIQKQTNHIFSKFRTYWRHFQTRKIAIAFVYWNFSTKQVQKRYCSVSAHVNDFCVGNKNFLFMSKKRGINEQFYFDWRSVFILNAITIVLERKLFIILITSHI